MPADDIRAGNAGTFRVHSGGRSTGSLHLQFSDFRAVYAILRTERPFSLSCRATRSGEIESLGKRVRHRRRTRGRDRESGLLVTGHSAGAGHGLCTIHREFIRTDPDYGQCFFEGAYPDILRPGAWAEGQDRELLPSCDAIRGTTDRRRCSPRSSGRRRPRPLSGLKTAHRLRHAADTAFLALILRPAAARSRSAGTGFRDRISP